MAEVEYQKIDYSPASKTKDDIVIFETKQYWDTFHLVSVPLSCVFVIALLSIAPILEFIVGATTIGYIFVGVTVIIILLILLLILMLPTTHTLTHSEYRIKMGVIFVWRIPYAEIISIQVYPDGMFATCMMVGFKYATAFSNRIRIVRRNGMDAVFSIVDKDAFLNHIKRFARVSTPSGDILKPRRGFLCKFLGKMKRAEVILTHLSSASTSCSSSSCERSKSSCPVANNIVNLCITGAAGQIAYSLVFDLLRGKIFGSSQISLRLLDIPEAQTKLNGVKMEIEDCAFENLKEIVSTSSTSIAFHNADVVIFLGAFPRQAGMERKDLIAKNTAIFKNQGIELDRWAHKSVKVIVVGNPANTNCATLAKFAPSIPSTNFTALTRLDENRAKAYLAQKVNVPVNRIVNTIIWGNHSATQYPDSRLAIVLPSSCPHSTIKHQTTVNSLINDEQWIRTLFIPKVQQRGAEVIKARGVGSAASAANAICDHLRDWILGSNGRIVSMAVVSDGSYGIPKNLVFSFPAICHHGGSFEIVQDIKFDDFSQKMIEATTKELLEEKNAASALY